MKSIKLIPAFALIGCLFFTACGPTSVAYRTRPSAPVYVRPVAPGAGHIWVGDDYIWRGGRYEYRPGYWVAPRPGRTYVPGYWNRSRRGDVWIKGRWR